MSGERGRGGRGGRERGGVAKGALGLTKGGGGGAREAPASAGGPEVARFLNQTTKADFADQPSKQNAKQRTPPPSKTKRIPAGADVDLNMAVVLAHGAEAIADSRTADGGFRGACAAFKAWVRARYFGEEKGEAGGQQPRQAPVAAA